MNLIKYSRTRHPCHLPERLLWLQVGDDNCLYMENAVFRFLIIITTQVSPESGSIIYYEVWGNVISNALLPLLLFICCSGDYWIGLAQVTDNHVYWTIDIRNRDEVHRGAYFRRSSPIDFSELQWKQCLHLWRRCSTWWVDLTQHWQQTLSSSIFIRASIH